MKTITFYSYKGGVGRSLTLSNIAMRLADLGKKVCIIDFDLEAPGLHLKFDKYIESNDIKKGLVEYLYDYQENNYIPENFDEYLLDIYYDSKLEGLINFFPAGDVNSNDYWKKLSSINWKELFYSNNSKGVELLLNLKEMIRKDINPDFLLIDSRTGITDISGIAMTLLADSIVTLAANNQENILGTSKVIKSLKNDENKLLGKPLDIYFVLTRIPYYIKPEDKHKEAQLINSAANLLNKDEDLVDEIFVIHSDPELEEEEKFKINHRSKSKSENVVPIEEDYLILFEELTKSELNGDEIIKFNKLRDSELLIEEARKSSDNSLKIELLEEALKLNENSLEALHLIGIAHHAKGNYSKAVTYYNKGIKKSSNANFFKTFKAQNLYKLGKKEEAKNILKGVLVDDETNFGALVILSNILYDEKQFEETLVLNKKLIKYHSDYSIGYNLVGNSYRVLNDYDNALKFVYKCLEQDPRNALGTLTLGEIYSELGNDEEFFKNLQLAFVFGINSKDFQEILKNEGKVYSKYYNDKRFLDLLKNYRIKVNLV